MDMSNAAMDARLRLRHRAQGEHRVDPGAARNGGPLFLDRARDVIDGNRLDETFVDAICDPPQVFTYGGMIAHVLTFAAHRRTLAIGALRFGRITDLGAGDPMRWVADAA